MLEGVLAPGRHRLRGGASPATCSRARPGPPRRRSTATYSETQYVASFVGFAPASNPELLVAVVVDEPLYVHTGGEVAAPVFGEIAEFALPYLGISPD